jgi:hypothetical protein
VAAAEMAEGGKAEVAAPEATPEIAAGTGGSAEGDGAQVPTEGEAAATSAEAGPSELSEGDLQDATPPAPVEPAVDSAVAGRRPTELAIISEAEGAASGKEGAEGAERGSGEETGAASQAEGRSGSSTHAQRRSSMNDRLNPNNQLAADCSLRASNSRRAASFAEPSEVERQAASKQSPLAAARWGELEQLVHHAVGGRLEARDSLQFAPLHFAACYGHAKAAELLLEKGAGADPVRAPASLPPRCSDSFLGAGAH